MWKKPSLGFLVGYAFLILTETVLIRKPFNGEHLKFELLWSWRAWSIQRKQILTNVFMFIPVGIMTGQLWKWRGLIATAGLSVVIEVLQLVSQRGLCEVDDLLHNMIGAVIGFGIVMMVKERLKK